MKKGRNRKMSREREYMMNLEHAEKEFNQAQKTHDIDGMIKHLKKFQECREKLTALHDAEFEEWKKKMINELIVKKCRSNDDCETCRMNH